MTGPDPRLPGQDRPERSFEDVMWARVNRKRDRIHAEIKRNREGGHRIPTWVLTAVLGVLVLGLLFMIFFG